MENNLRGVSKDQINFVKEQKQGFQNKLISISLKAGKEKMKYHLMESDIKVGFYV